MIDKIWVVCPACHGNKHYDGPSDMCGCWMNEYAEAQQWHCSWHQCRACEGWGRKWISINEAVERGWPYVLEVADGDGYWDEKRWEAEARKGLTKALRAAIGEEQDEDTVPL
jgi:hypothetical protein